MSFTALMCKGLAGGYFGRIRIFLCDQKENAKCKLSFEVINHVVYGLGNWLAVVESITT